MPLKNFSLFSVRYEYRSGSERYEDHLYEYRGGSERYDDDRYEYRRYTYEN